MLRPILITGLMVGKIMKALLFVFIFTSSFCYSQEKKMNHPIKFGLYYDINTEDYSSNGLNNYLANNGFSHVQNNFSSIAFGFSLRQVDKPSIVRLNFGNGTTVASSNCKSTITKKYLGFDYLYNFSKNENWVIAPLASIKINFCKLNAATEKAVLQKKADVGANLLLGLEADRKIKIYFLDLFLGIKGGYDLAPNSQDWGKISDIPKISLAGLNIGFCGRIEFDFDKLNREGFYQRQNHEHR